MDDPELAREIICGAHTIIDLGTEETIFICIGQTPHYLAQIIAKHRRTFCVAFSGRAFQDEYTTPNEQQQQTYKHYLESLGLTQSFFRDNIQNIILVDHTHSGKSPQLFIKMLETILDVKLTNGTSMQFVNLISPAQASYDCGWIIDPPRNIVTTVGYVVLPNLIPLANEGNLPETSTKKHTKPLPRSIPSYPHYRWDKPSSHYQAECLEGEKNIKWLEAAYQDKQMHKRNFEVYFKPYKRKIDLKTSKQYNLSTSWTAIKCTF
jgi:hypothetical protein